MDILPQAMHTVNEEKWNRALKSAEDALSMFKKAKDERPDGVVNSVNTLERLFLH